MADFRVLLIAPDSDLENVKNEIRGISAALRATVLSNGVTRTDVMDIMRGHQWDIVWVAAHGTDEGILISDGLLSTADFTSIVRNTNATMVVLNTCDSKFIGLELNYELGVDVVCVEGEVGDASAFQMGRLLAQNLASGMSRIDAFNRSKPGFDDRYHFLFGRKTPNGEDVVQPDERIDEARTIRMMRSVIAEWDKRLTSRIDNMEKRLQSEIDSLKDSIDEITRTADEFVRLPLFGKEALLIAFALLIMPIPLFFEEIRNFVDIGWQSATILAITMYIGAMVLWSYMWWGAKRLSSQRQHKEKSDAQH